MATQLSNVSKLLQWPQEKFYHCYMKMSKLYQDLYGTASRLLPDINDGLSQQTTAFYLSNTDITTHT